MPKETQICTASDCLLLGAEQPVENFYIYGDHYQRQCKHCVIRKIRARERMGVKNSVADHISRLKGISKHKRSTALYAMVVNRKITAGQHSEILRAVDFY